MHMPGALAWGFMDSLISHPLRLSTWPRLLTAWGPQIGTLLRWVPREIILKARALRGLDGSCKVFLSSSLRNHTATVYWPRVNQRASPDSSVGDPTRTGIREARFMKPEEIFRNHPSSIPVWNGISSLSWLRLHIPVFLVCVLSPFLHMYVLLP